MKSPSTSSEGLVLGILAEADGDYASGEALSNKLGLTPSEVFHDVESLRDRGYVIEAAPARGYRLVELPDRLTEVEIDPLLSTHDFGQTLHHFDVCTSTNDLARELAAEGASHGEALIAESQTSGRGRRGRSWVSPPGANLYLSLVLRPDFPPARAPELTFVAAVGAAETLAEFGVRATIKWPNDLEFEGKKVGGILTELSSEVDRIAWVILGIGVNLNLTAESIPAELRLIATSARIVRNSLVPRARFTAALLARLEHWYDRHQEEGFEPVAERWRDLTSTLGRTVRVRLAERTFEGVARDLDPPGALLVSVGAGIERVVAGDVEELRTQ